MFVLRKNFGRNQESMHRLYLISISINIIGSMIIVIYPGHHCIEVVQVYAGEELLTESLNEPRPVDSVSEREVT